jgi:diguanylate cyclase (GGDEF)-like protein
MSSLICSKDSPSVGVEMILGGKIWPFLSSPQGFLPSLGAAGVALVIASWLRHLPVAPNALLYGELQITSGFLAITFAALALVRFRGTRDRLPLVLGCGFLIVGSTIVSSSLVFFHLSEPDSGMDLRDPMTWVVGRTFLAVLFIASLIVERRLPTTLRPGREIAVLLVLVVLFGSVLSVTHGWLPDDLVFQPGGIFSRPGNLLPAAIFLLAMIGFHRHLRDTSSPFDRSLFIAAGLNVACSFAASQSESSLDAPFVFAGILQFGSYSALLGGALLDIVKLFETTRQSALADPLTGLANYRRLVSTMENEIERSQRTGRAFSLLLFDVDRLKKINDEYGHLVGSKALCRVANVLRVHSRAIDTSARYAGDEFVLVLPETGMNAAQEVLRRICGRVATDGEFPPITVSGGVAVYPQDGERIESLLSIADQAMYRAKNRIDQKLLA